MRRFTLRLPKRLNDNLELISKTENISKNTIVILALKDFVKKTKKEEQL